MERIGKRNPLLDLAPFPPTPKLDLSDKRTREIVANVALTLTEKRNDASLRKAFEKFGLDPQDPLNWRCLLQDLAEVHFDQPARRPRGAPPKWNENLRMLFHQHVATARISAQKHGHSRPTGERLAAYLQWKWPNYYGHIDAASIRRYIASGPPGAVKSPRKR